MPEVPSLPGRRGAATGRAGAGLDMLGLFLSGLAFRLLLLYLFPVPYGEDGFGRIYFKDRIFLSHWLPMAQWLVHATSRLSDDIYWVRLVFAVCGALAACGFYLFLRGLASRRAALWGAGLFCFNKLYVVLSLMPYQDVLFLGLYYAGVSFLFPVPEGRRRLRSWWGSLFFGLANLTRYEGWFVLPILALWKLRRESNPPTPSRIAGSLVRTAVYFGWAPTAWFVMSWIQWHGWNEFLFQPADRQFYGWHPHFDLVWATRYGIRWLYWIVLFGTPVTLLATVGAYRLWRTAAPLHPRLKLLFANVALTCVFFFFIIGKEQETVFRFVMFAFGAVLVLTALGLDDLSARWVGWPRFRIAAGITILAGLIVHSAVGVARLNQLPEHQDPYQVARLLEQSLEDSEKALVVAERAKDLQDDAPILYQRIVAQTRLRRDRVLAAGNLPVSGSADLLKFARVARIRYLVVFQDFKPRLAADRFFSRLAETGGEWLEPILETGTVRVYRVKAWPEM